MWGRGFLTWWNREKPWESESRKDREPCPTYQGWERQEQFVKLREEQSAILYPVFPTFLTIQFAHQPQKKSKLLCVIHSFLQDLVPCTPAFLSSLWHLECCVLPGVTSNIRFYLILFINLKKSLLLDLARDRFAPEIFLMVDCAELFCSSAPPPCVCRR